MKKKLLLVLLGCFFLTGASTTYARELYNYELNQECMKLEGGLIYILSSYDSADHITCYDYFGNCVWDAMFQTKIVSWQISGDVILVFSMNRYSDSTHLTCLAKKGGNFIWQRP